MERGSISIDAMSGGFDLQSTVESGQSYLWGREDGRMYTEPSAYGGDAWYWTTHNVEGDPAVIRVRQTNGAIEWESNITATPHLRHLLRLDDDLPTIRSRSADDGIVQDAYDAFWGMRLVRDDSFGCLISFICSAQMRVERIYAMQQSLREKYGEPIEFDGKRYRAYPTPDAIAGATESELRDLGLGYRAPYVQQTATMVAAGEVDPTGASGRSYEDAREYLTQFVGVGNKVADCVLLFSLDFLEAVPLDTWIRTTIAEYFPDCDRGTYADTSQAIRDSFGGDVAGYVQTYIFHYLRNDGPSR